LTVTKQIRYKCETKEYIVNSVLSIKRIRDDNYIRWAHSN